MDGSASHADGAPARAGGRRFRQSVLKRRKLAEIVRLLGATEGLRCLDLGADNGVISYLLRARGGEWTSADLDAEAVAAIRRLVGERVYRLHGAVTPFATDAFDRVVVVDLLEHVADDAAFVAELFRIIRPGGELIVNVPHHKDGVLRRLRLLLGETDEEHGHVRPGYTRATLRGVLGDLFAVIGERTYSRAVSELLDIATRAAMARLKAGRSGAAKGTILVEEDFRRHRGLFALYAVGEPLTRALVALDHLLIGTEGHMLIVKARSLKRESAAASRGVPPGEEYHR